MALSGSIVTNHFSNSTVKETWLTFNWNATQNIAENSSTVSWNVTVSRVNTSWVQFYNTSIIVNGTQYGTNGQYSNGKVIASGSFKVWHDAAGNGSFSMSMSANVYYSGSGYIGASGTCTLNQIPRKANLTSAPNFNDEENPTIYYSNPAGNNVSVLQACISFDGSKDDIKYRAIPKNGTSYTFELTEEERNTLRVNTNTKNSRSILFYLVTVIGSQTYYSTIERTLTIANASPVLSPTAADIGEGSLSLTGDANKIIKGFNHIEYTSGAAARKGASIVSQRIVCGSQASTSGNGSFVNVDSANIVFTATDSRGNTTSKTLNKTLINYIKPTCNIADNKPDVKGNVEVQCSGNYFNGTFGAVANTLEVQYRYKVQDGTYSDWEPMTAVINGNTYTATAPLTGLDYQTTYVFQTRAIDKIYWQGIMSEEIIVRSYPVFDWGKNDFNVNGALNMQGKSIFDYIYPVGAVYMSFDLTNPKYLFGGEWENIQGRFLIAAGTGTDDRNISKTFNVGQTGGEYDHALTIQEMPSHTHTIEKVATFGHSSGVNFGASGDWLGNNSINTGSSGGSWTHNNTPPYLAVYMWKRVS